MLEYVNSLLNVSTIRNSYNVSNVKKCPKRKSRNIRTLFLQIIFEIPFNSRRKWHLVIAKGKQVGERRKINTRLLIEHATGIYSGAMDTKNIVAWTMAGLARS